MVRRGPFGIPISRIVGPAPVASGYFAEAGKAIGRGTESLGGQRPYFIGLGLSLHNFVGLVSVFETRGQEDLFACRKCNVEVQIEVFLDIASGIELRGGIASQRGIYRVLDHEVGFVASVIGAEGPTSQSGSNLVPLTPTRRA